MGGNRSGIGGSRAGGVGIGVDGERGEVGQRGEKEGSGGERRLLLIVYQVSRKKYFF